MQVSSDPDSPFHWKKFYRESPTIFVDGEETENVTFASDVEGYVLVIRHTGQGHPVFAGGRYLIDRIEGRVQIKGEAFAPPKPDMKEPENE